MFVFEAGHYCQTSILITILRGNGCKIIFNANAFTKIAWERLEGSIFYRFFHNSYKEFPSQLIHIIDNQTVIYC